MKDFKKGLSFGMGFDMLAKIRYELVKEYEKANIHFGNYSVEVSQS